MEALEMTLLLDYYGELLTERQLACMDMRWNQDLSLSEIAQEVGVSRQGVHDLLNRAEESLLHMEQKLGCIRRGARLKSVAADLRQTADRLASGENISAEDTAAILRHAAEALEE